MVIAAVLVGIILFIPAVIAGALIGGYLGFLFVTGLWQWGLGL